MNKAVLLLAFNRPKLTQRVFEVIQKVKPATLFVMADGPRPGIKGDIKKCLETRKILEQVDWKCEVKTLFFESNRGCAVAVAEGISWFFNNIEQGIILEDDCLPDESFFPYCYELLNYYKNDSRIMHINGNNFNAIKFKHGNESYSFGSYPQAWGWASWKRAWDMFDLNMSQWPEIKKNNLLKNMNWSWYEKLIQENKYDELYISSRKYTWDYQWHLSVFVNNGLTIVPKVNLISNIGFGIDATHTTNYRKACTEIETSSIEFPLQHPDKMVVDKAVDKVYRKIMIGTPKTLFVILRSRIKSIVGRTYRKI